MINKPLYDKTISILVKAYLNDTLQPNNCWACAVGNLVAANANKSYYKTLSIWNKDGFSYKWVDSDVSEVVWYKAVYTVKGSQCIVEDNYTGEIKRQIESTGYNLQEVAKIEFAFESGSGGRYENMINGLMAVVEVLGQIHEVSKELTEETKLMFTK